jgi:hypothetical protein
VFTVKTLTGYLTLPKLELPSQMRAAAALYKTAAPGGPTGKKKPVNFPAALKSQPFSSLTLFSLNLLV